MTKPAEPNARDARAAVVAELADWSDRFHAFADVNQQCADEERATDPTRSETHAVMGETYRIVAGMVDRRLGEVRSGGGLL